MNLVSCHDLIFELCHWLRQCKRRQSPHLCTLAEPVFSDQAILS